NNARPYQAAAILHLADEMLDHGLSGVEIRDDAAAQWSNSPDVPRGAPDHLLGFLPHRKHLLLAALVGDRDHRRFIERDVSASNPDQGGGRAEIDGNVFTKGADEAGKHDRLSTPQREDDRSFTGGKRAGPPPGSRMHQVGKTGSERWLGPVIRRRAVQR